jgi:hypothetical protein
MQININNEILKTCSYVITELSYQQKCLTELNNKVFIPISNLLIGIFFTLCKIIFLKSVNKLFIAYKLLRLANRVKNRIKCACKIFLRQALEMHMHEKKSTSRQALLDDFFN